MEFLRNIIYKIQSNLCHNYDIRARYLQNLYGQFSKKMIERMDYIDIGCGFGTNSAVFGEEYSNVFCSDFNRDGLVTCKEYMKHKENISYIAADAQILPFKNENFDLVTAFSLIEHVPDQEKMLSEAFRILRKKGNLVIQFPNKYFFMELHSGIPFYYIFPDFMKTWILKKLSINYLIKIPTTGQIKKTICNIEPHAQVRVIEVIYPDELVPYRLKKVYSILKKTGIFRKIPLGWMVICEK